MSAVNPSDHPRRASAEELPRLADVLGSAFENYPWTRWTVPGEDARRRLVEIQRRYLVHAHEHGGRIWTTPRLDAVAALVPADLPAPPERTLRAIARLHGAGWSRIVDHETAAGASRPDAAWTLATVGVVPVRHGRGVGMSLLRAALADVGEGRVALETSSPANVRLYERLGFAVVDHVRGPGPDVWVMLR